MGLLKAITASEQIVAQGKSAIIYSITFFSHTGDVTVELLSGGSAGTTVWKILLDLTTAIGDENVRHVFGPDGGQIQDGMYVKITGTTTVSLDFNQRG